MSSMIKKLAILLLILFPVSSLGMEQVLMSGTLVGGAGDLSTSQTRAIVMGGSNFMASGVSVWCNVPTDAIFKHLQVTLTTAPGAGKSWTFDVNVSGLSDLDDADFSVTISGTDTYGEDMSDNLFIPANQPVRAFEVDFRATASGGPATTPVYWTLVSQSMSPKTSWYCGAVNNVNLSTTLTEYLTLSGESSTIYSTEQRAQMIVPFSGTLHSLWAGNGAPATTTPATAWYDFTVRKNAVDTAITCRLDSINILVDNDCADTVNTVTVAAGDRITVKSVPSGGPVTIAPTVSLAITADTDGQYAIPTSSDNTQSTATNYRQVWSGRSNVGTAATGIDQITRGGVSIQALYAFTSNTPGVLRHFIYTLQKNAVDTTLTCDQTGAVQTCVTTGADIYLTTLDLLDTKVARTGLGVPNNTPDISYLATASTSAKQIWTDQN